MDEPKLQSPVPLPIQDARVSQTRRPASDNIDSTIEYAQDQVPTRDYLSDPESQGLYGYHRAEDYHGENEAQRHLAVSIPRSMQPRLPQEGELALLRQEIRRAQPQSSVHQKNHNFDRPEYKRPRGSSLAFRNLGPRPIDNTYQRNSGAAYSSNNSVPYVLNHGPPYPPNHGSPYASNNGPTYTSNSAPPGYAVLNPQQTHAMDVDAHLYAAGTSTMPHEAAIPRAEYSGQTPYHVIEPVQSPLYFQSQIQQIHRDNQRGYAQQYIGSAQMHNQPRKHASVVKKPARMNFSNDARVLGHREAWNHDGAPLYLPQDTHQSSRHTNFLQPGNHWDNSIYIQNAQVAADSLVGGERSYSNDYKYRNKDKRLPQPSPNNLARGTMSLRENNPPNIEPMNLDIQISKPASAPVTQGVQEALHQASVEGTRPVDENPKLSSPTPIRTQSPSVPMTGQYPQNQQSLQLSQILNGVVPTIQQAVAAPTQVVTAPLFREPQGHHRLSEEGNRDLWIGNVPMGVQKDMLDKIFRCWGPISNINICQSKVQVQRFQFAFIRCVTPISPCLERYTDVVACSFDKAIDAEAAMKYLDGRILEEIGGACLIVRPALKKFDTETRSRKEFPQYGQNALLNGSSDTAKGRTRSTSDSSLISANPNAQRKVSQSSHQGKISRQVISKQESRAPSDSSAITDPYANEAQYIDKSAEAGEENFSIKKLLASPQKERFADVQQLKIRKDLKALDLDVERDTVSPSHPGLPATPKTRANQHQATVAKSPADDRLHKPTGLEAKPVALGDFISPVKSQRHPQQGHVQKHVPTSSAVANGSPKKKPKKSTIKMKQLATRGAISPSEMGGDQKPQTNLRGLQKASKHPVVPNKVILQINTSDHKLPLEHQSLECSSADQGWGIAGKAFVQPDNKAEDDGTLEGIDKQIVQDVKSQVDKINAGQQVVGSKSMASLIDNETMRIVDQNSRFDASSTLDSEESTSVSVSMSAQPSSNSQSELSDGAAKEPEEPETGSRNGSQVPARVPLAQEQHVIMEKNRLGLRVEDGDAVADLANLPPIITKQQATEREEQPKRSLSQSKITTPEALRKPPSANELSPYLSTTPTDPLKQDRKGSVLDTVQKEIVVTNQAQAQSSEASTKPSMIVKSPVLIKSIEKPSVTTRLVEWVAVPRSPLNVKHQHQVEVPPRSSSILTPSPPIATHKKKQKVFNLVEHGDGNVFGVLEPEVRMSDSNVQDSPPEEKLIPVENTRLVSARQSSSGDFNLSGPTADTKEGLYIATSDTHEQEIQGGKQIEEETKGMDKEPHSTLLLAETAKPKHKTMGKSKKGNKKQKRKTVLPDVAPAPPPMAESKYPRTANLPEVETPYLANDEVLLPPFKIREKTVSGLSSTKQADDVPETKTSSLAHDKVSSPPPKARDANISEPSSTTLTGDLHEAETSFLQAAAGTKGKEKASEFEYTDSRSKADAFLGSLENMYSNTERPFGTVASDTPSKLPSIEEIAKPFIELGSNQLRKVGNLINMNRRGILETLLPKDTKAKVESEDTKESNGMKENHHAPITTFCELVDDYYAQKKAHYLPELRACMETYDDGSTRPPSERSVSDSGDKDEHNASKAPLASSSNSSEKHEQAAKVSDAPPSDTDDKSGPSDGKVSRVFPTSASEHAFPLGDSEHIEKFEPGAHEAMLSTPSNTENTALQGERSMSALIDTFMNLNPTATPARPTVGEANVTPSHSPRRAPAMQATLSSPKSSKTDLPRRPPQIVTANPSSSNKENDGDSGSASGTPKSPLSYSQVASILHSQFLRPQNREGGEQDGYPDFKEDPSVEELAQRSVEWRTAVIMGEGHKDPWAVPAGERRWGREGGR